MKKSTTAVQKKTYDRRRMKPKAFIARYGRILIGGMILLAVLFCAIFAPLLQHEDPDRVNPYTKNLRPGTDGYVLGTDSWGRDIYTQLLYGARVALLVPVGVQLMACLFGTVLGMLCGYYKRLDSILSRIMEAFNAIPTLVLCLLICAVLGNGTFQLMFSLAVDATIGVSRLIRGKVLSIRQEEYIECEKVMGASDLRTLFKHVLPACYNTLFVRFSTGLSGTLMSMVGLAFMSIGIDAAIPNWGVMVSLGKQNLLLMPFQCLYPALCIVVTTFAFCMIGDGMRNIIGSGRS